MVKRGIAPVKNTSLASSRRIVGVIEVVNPLLVDDSEDVMVIDNDEAAKTDVAIEVIDVDALDHSSSLSNRR